MAKITLQQLQNQMINYLTDDDQLIADQVVDQGGIDVPTRLHIYKNAYVSRLREVIDTDHGVLGIYLGDDLFEQMVQGYVTDFPSDTTSLRHYADHLPQFLQQTLPFSGYPILSEIARFERLLLTAFDAEDAERFSRIELQNIPHEQWPTLTFKFHPSVQRVEFQFNAVESWQALKAEQAPQAPFQQINIWLLWRNDQRLTEFRSLSAQEDELLQMILAGHDFSDLCDHLLASENDQQAASIVLNYLLSWLDQGILRKI